MDMNQASANHAATTQSSYLSRELLSVTQNAGKYLCLRRKDIEFQTRLPSLAVSRCGRTLKRPNSGGDSVLLSTVHLGWSWIGSGYGLNPFTSYPTHADNGLNLYPCSLDRFNPHPRGLDQGQPTFCGLGGLNMDLRIGSVYVHPLDIQIDGLITATLNSVPIQVRISSL
jgi:hypothetical protein